MKRNNKLDTFVKHSGDDNTFILLITVGISILIVELASNVLGLSNTGDLTAEGGFRLICVFLFAFNIWSCYYNIKNEDVDE